MTVGEIYNTGKDISLVFALILLASLIGVAVWFNSILPFMTERNYIKAEIERSFNDDEYKYWKSELRQLYLSYIPLIGRFFR